MSSRKPLLSENTVRRFMKLATLDNTLAENFVDTLEEEVTEEATEETEALEETTEEEETLEETETTEEDTLEEAPAEEAATE